MGKFTSQPYVPRGPVSTTGKPTSTFEGGAAQTRDPKSDLFLLAAVNMAGENTFYEVASDRDFRFRELVHAVTLSDPDWVARFANFLRTRMNMRSAAVVMAAESALARREHNPLVKSTITVRQMVSSVLQRADEPAEFIAYWQSRTGKKTLPGGVQRGIADAVSRLFTERAALKYDGVGRPWRMIDVVALTKPHPVGAWQADLFNHLADRRWKRPEIRTTSNLPMISAYQRAKEMSKEDRRAWFLADPTRLGEAGMTWEEFSSLGPMDKKAWEAMIPHMGLMALCRNLRNFDQAEVSDKVAAQVIARLTDPEEVRRSQQFPYRFLSAYRAAPSLRWGHALDQALAASTASIPKLSGKTLILVDTSASMTDTVSEKSKIRHVDVGALFGVALAARGCEVDLVGFANGTFKHPLVQGGSVLKQCESFCARIGEVGHGTETVSALLDSWNNHDRVVIISDMQAFRYPGYPGYGRRQRGYGSSWDLTPARSMSVSEAVSAQIPMFGVNTSGYAASSINTSEPNRFEIGGFSDQLFSMIDLLVRGQNADWPF